MDNKVIQNLRAVSGDKPLFRQWYQKLTTALGQVAGAHEKIVHRLVIEFDLGREMEELGEESAEMSLTKLRDTFGTC